MSSHAASSLPRPTASSPPWGRSLRTLPLVYTLQSALFLQPSPGARESWPGQGPAPSLDSLWPHPFLFLGLARTLSSSASRHPRARDSWTPWVQAVASSGDPELAASSCDLLCLRPLLLSFFSLKEMFIYWLCWVFYAQFSSVQSLSHVRLFATPWTAARQASLSIANSRSLLRLMSIESVMPSNHLILCCPLLLLPSIFPSIRVFSKELALLIRWPKYWSFSFSISSSHEYSGQISNTTVEKHQCFCAAGAFSRCSRWGLLPSCGAQASPSAASLAVEHAL